LKQLKTVLIRNGSRNLMQFWDMSYKPSAKISWTVFH
jgi:hypothetical protein